MHVATTCPAAWRVAYFALALTAAGGISAASAQEEPPDPRPSDDQLESELAAELTAVVVPAPTARAGTSSARGLSNVFNPAISANGLVLTGWSGSDEAGEESDRHEHGIGDLETGIHLQEIELRLSSLVDPYLRADLTLAAHEDEIGFEEAYLSTLTIPRMTVRAGLMYAAFGRHNELHTHAFPFLTAPLPWRLLLGEEGLADPGVSLDVLLPLPVYTALNAQVFAGDWGPLAGRVVDDPQTAEDEIRPDAREDHDFAYVAHLETLVELGDSTTVEIGASYVGGNNGLAEWTHVVGTDLTLKWRPIEAERYTGVDWTTEYLWVDRGGGPDNATLGGAYSSLRYQFAQRWRVQGRGAVLGWPASTGQRTLRGEVLAAFVPSEFSALRLQYAYQTLEDSDDDSFHEVILQASFSIGSHPAHAY